MYKILSLIIITLLTLATGCAMSSGVFATGKDTYTVAVTGGSGCPKATVMKKAYQEANAYCSQRGMVMQPVGTSYSFDNGYPSFSLEFRNVKPSDQEYKRPNLKPVANQAVDINIH